MTPRKSQRSRKPATTWEEKKAPPAASDPKLTVKTARNRPETALKPVPIGRLPKSTKLDHGRLPELPIYQPPLNLRYKPSKSIATDLTELQTFQQLFSQAVVNIIVDTTNSYAKNARETA
jgi:hypothetical protein